MTSEPFSDHDLWAEACRRGLPPDGILLAVCATAQTLQVIEDGKVGRTYVISTSEKGLGGEHGSRKTSPGFHKIIECIGEGEPAGTVFKGRVPTGEVVPESHWRGERTGDLITTRILRLRGLEPGINSGPGVDAFERYIYIHGTNREDQLGRPASAGCVRIGNRDVLDLFKQTKDKTAWCWIG